MGYEHLIDSNVVSDYLGNRMPLKSTAFVDKLEPAISVISRIEILGWYSISKKQMNNLLRFVNMAHIFELDEPVILQTIMLRQKVRIKTPDAIIAATAIVNKLILVSHNFNDFTGIKGLTVVDPYNL